MNLKNILLIALLLIILTTWGGVVSASQDNADDALTVSEDSNPESLSVDECLSQLESLDSNELSTTNNNIILEKTDTPPIAAGANSKINPKLSISKATFKTKAKTKKYSITLKSYNKAIKNTNVYLKIGKKTFNAKTDNNGKATFLIKKLTKKGKYSGTFSFKGSKYYYAITKKLSVTITKKKCTIKVSGGSNKGDTFVDSSQAFQSLNSFRLEDGVWYWNKDDTTKTYFNTGGNTTLKALSWDSDLEETAKIRAKEISISFSHNRPDGSSCWTIYPDYWGMGENIAYGTSLSGKAVTELWKETNDPYSGQGHRRNMLDPGFNRVGIAGFEKDGIIYWVQAFGYK
ncbi:MAG: CAP domain-containing protein [Methanobrevibacter thaueri]|nr:CAP domain-containing protein [Methanobrevibacter thaueri]